MDKDIAIQVKNVSKTFRIPHEKVSSLRGAFVGLFRNRSFEEFKALDDVSFEVKRGEFFGIIGRNGSGKSTLLKILAGIYQPDMGKVKIHGMISPFLELGIGFNPELSGRDNVYLNATVLGMSKKQIDEKFDSIVAFSELGRFIDQKLKNYSSGMQVRLAFSVSIHANRDILLMDEVLAVGDSNFQSKCLEEFSKYRDSGRTVIIVTHDIGVVQRYCDRAMLLRSGKIVKMGAADEVTNEYVHENMADEETYIASKEVEKIVNNEIHEEKSRNRQAEVQKVEVRDKEGRVKNIIQTGEWMDIVVTNRLNVGMNNPVFGLVIREAHGKNQVFITNTQFKKMETGRMECGDRTVTYAIDNVFATGEYSISPAIADENLRILDWKDDMKRFKIVNKEYASGGCADFVHTITVS